MTTDKITTIIGFVSSIVIVANQQALIEPKLGTAISAILVAIFGYFTNKKVVK